MEGIGTITESDIWYAEKANWKDRFHTPTSRTAKGPGCVLIPEATPEPYPNGYFKSSFSGRGFYCHDCHLLYVSKAPSAVRHCGRVDTVGGQSEPLPEAPRVTLLQRILKLFR